MRIHFKVLLYIFKALRGQAPQYLGQLCCYKQHSGHLRQPRDLSLQVPLTQRSATEAAFSVQGPVLCNKLPHDIKAAIFIHNFVYFYFFNITLYLIMSLNDVIIVSAMISCAGFVRMFLNTACK